MRGSASDHAYKPVLEESTMEEGDPRDVEDEKAEEGRKSVGRTNMPTTVEQEEHARTHCPYRSWCRHCAKSRARNSPHGAGVFERKVKTTWRRYQKS